MKKLLCAFVLFITFLSYASLCDACSGCQVTTHCGGNDQTKDATPVERGCETLEVIIYNDTDYTFVVDNNYHPSNTAIGDTSSFTDIAPRTPTTATSAKFYIKGVSTDNGLDEVNTSIRYIAQQHNKNSGAQFVVNLKKSSCNVSSAKLKMSDTRCYIDCREDDPSIKVGDCQWAGCALGSNGYTHGQTCWTNCAGETTDAVCIADYNNYDSYDCHEFPKSNPTTAISADSSVVASPGLYTLGINIDGESNASSDKDATKVSSASSYFYCDKSSVCGDSDADFYSCGNGAPEHNKTAKFGFYVEPSPIETLTVTFPFNAQSPIGRIMKSVIYNNLDTTSLASLGAFYSVNPVAIQNTSIAFSTLCNADTCPKP